MHLSEKKIKRAVVLGLGVSGMSAVELAATHGIAVTGIDENPGKLNTNNKKTTIITNFNCDKLPDADLIIISPGIADNSRLGKLAADSGVPVISELDFASRFAKVPIIAVTGTNGKTTVTEMTNMLLENSVAAGNIGYPLSSAVEDKKAGTLVVEVSSFQLEKSPSFTPNAAVILNISSDHIDRYANFAEYKWTKFNIFRNIANSADMIINYNLLDDWKKWNSSLEKPHKSLPLTFSAEESNADISRTGEVVHLQSMEIGDADISSSEIRGIHNIENFMAAAALAARIQDDNLEDRINYLLNNFRISPHRQEIVTVKNGITYVNDSKSTNPDSLIAALKSFGRDKNICLIAGGLDKDMDFSEIVSHKGKIKKAFLIGESKKMLQKLWAPQISSEICLSLENAIEKAEESASKGDTILLSPGCASMDMFANYKERGDIFCKIIHQSTA
jgi:UDP-N-acetylmuramoylalanine--D-glutamate ligase